MNSLLGAYLEGMSHKEIPGGLLLIGPSGLTQLEDAELVAEKLLNVSENKLHSHPDFMYVNCDINGGVEVADEILSRANLLPAIAPCTCVLIHRMDKMTEAAQNKMLKTVEEVSHVVFIMTAYDQNRVLPTVKSRVQTIAYEPLNKVEFKTYCNENNIEYSDVLYAISRGCPGRIGNDAALEEVYEKVSSCLKNDEYENLLKILRLAEEKDYKEKSFFSAYRGEVKSLLSFMAGVFVDISLNDDNNSLIREAEVLAEHISKCEKQSYTKENFFFCIASLINIRRAGKEEK